MKLHKSHSEVGAWIRRNPYLHMLLLLLLLAFASYVIWKNP
jgi:hypothetical protein